MAVATLDRRDATGGPDRRFKNNRQLPMVLLSSFRLFSASGLVERQS